MNSILGLSSKSRQAKRCADKLLKKFGISKTNPIDLKVLDDETTKMVIILRNFPIIVMARLLIVFPNKSRQVLQILKVRKISSKSAEL